MKEKKVFRIEIDSIVQRLASVSPKFNTYWK